MVKHRRFSDKQKSGSIQEDENQNQPTSEKTSSNSYITSGMKYVYVIAITALLCGIFTPLTSGVDAESVIFGMLTIFLGLGGGIMIFLGIKNQKFTTPLICGGLGMVVISLIIIFELADRSLF
jgi:uncharacterized ion transporter superfamily protein YfcC|tara:strand:- start:97 stop:465 length:369 start_codon:yes stop_codon:yes gene_type:complete